MIKRKMLVAIAALSEQHRSSIRQAAQERGFEAVFCDDDAQALLHAQEAEVIFSSSAALAPNAPHLRWQCTPSAGVNQFFAVDAFVSRAAALSNSSGAYGVTIAEHIVMLALEMLRCQPEYNAIVARREWRRNLPVRSIKNSRVTLLGTGDIGQEAAVRLRAFGPSCLTGVNRSGKNPNGLFDSVRQQEELDDVLPQTDLLIISLPGTAETQHMLHAARLALLPDGALIVNVGRGTVIDQAALEKELRAGRLRAALDVFESEPLPAKSTLWACPNLLITPHTAGNMTLPYTVERIVALFLEDFDRYCAGQPLQRQVDLKKGY